MKTPFHKLVFYEQQCIHIPEDINFEFIYELANLISFCKVRLTFKLITITNMMDFVTAMQLFHLQF